MEDSLHSLGQRIIEVARQAAALHLKQLRLDATRPASSLASTQPLRTPRPHWNDRKAG